MDLSRFLDLFVAESREHIAAADEIITNLTTGGKDPEALRELFRHVHSLKGMAASMGYPAMTSLAHAAEDLMDAVRSEKIALDSIATALLLEALSCLESMVDSAERRAPVEHPAAQRLETRLDEARSPRTGSDFDESPLRTAAPGPPASHAPVQGPAGAVVPTWKVDLVLQQGAPIPAVRAAAALGRLEKIGRILRSDPPMAALRSGRFDGRLCVVLASSLSPKALATEVARIDEVESFKVVPDTTPLPVDPRSKAPASWVRVRADLLDDLVEEVLDLMLEQGRLSAAVEAGSISEAKPRAARSQLLVRKLYGDVVEMRLVPFQTVAHRIVRGVRDLSQELGKRVHFEITGQEVRVDRSLLDALVDPLLHLVRNSLDHGIESPEERASAGKPSAGSVRLHIQPEREQVRIVVEDDGRGLDPQELRRAAVERGLRTPSEVERLTDAEALLLITLPGFSTAEKVGRVSGRGVGMDVVRSAVESFRGRLLLEGEPGRGARVVLSLPLTLAVIQALMVRSAGQLYAVPISSIERTVHVDDEATLHTVDGSIELFSLETRLGIDRESRPRAGMRSALLYPAGGRTVGLVVDEVLGKREILVKPLLSPLDGMREYEGAALLQDGSVALVLDPVNLVSI